MIPHRFTFPAGASHAPTALRQTGLTLVELMVSIGLGLLVVLAATALLLSTKVGYTTQDEGARIEETGRYAIELIARSVRQAAYENWDGPLGRVRMTEELSTNLTGLDARRLNPLTPGLESPISNEVVNGSDVLAVRFFGAGEAPAGDGTIVNCAGVSVPAVEDQAQAEENRGWSIFYVARANETNIPELRCKYRASNGNWNFAPIAAEVESFQVLYGLDTDDDGQANRYLNATALNALDSGLGSDRNKLTNWKKVVVVKVALLLRSSQNSRSDLPTAEYNLFGRDYADAYASQDPGTRIRESELRVNERQRLRRTYTATIQLRNQPAGDPS